ncbi:MAG: DUF4360 domain-containing protein [Polyangiales bacterium]
MRAALSTLPLPMLLLALVGCSEPKAPRAPTSEPETTSSAVTSRPTAPPPRPPAGKTEPTANGTGCPPGSAHVAVDGKTVTVTFDGYGAEVSPSAKLAVRDCQVSVPGVPDKRIALASMAFEGELALEAGVKAKLMFNSYFQGNPGKPGGPELEHVGPYTQPLALRREIAPDAREWSECGKARDLNAVTRVRLHAASGEGGGKAKPSKLTLVLDEKPCSDG